MCIIYVTEHFTFRNVAKIIVNIDSEKNGRGKDCQEYLQINYNKNEEDKSIIVRKKVDPGKTVEPNASKTVEPNSNKTIEPNTSNKMEQIGS